MNVMLIWMLLIPKAFSQDFVFDAAKGRAVPSYMGEVKLLRGKVFKRNEKGTKEVGIGERFHRNDVIITQEKSFAKVLIVDDTLVSIGPKSEVRLDEFEFMEKTDRKMTLTLIAGQLTGNVRNKARPGDIKFKTKNTTMGIRGTYILMNQHQLKSMEISEFALLSGSAEVFDETNRNFQLKKNDRLIFVRDEGKAVSDQEATQLSPGKAQELAAPGVDEEKEFKPFLPYYVPDESSSLNKYFSVKNSAVEEKSGEPEDREEKKASWQENLEKLNQKLRDNQRRN